MTNSLLNVNAPPFFVSFCNSGSLSYVDVKGTVIRKVIDWGFPVKMVQKIEEIINEWFSGITLNSVLKLWEKKTTRTIGLQSPLNILTYNVQGWGSRVLESIELIFKTDTSICVFTEVGELWNSFTIPHFYTFYQKGTNNKGGVIIAVGKHLRATRVILNTENTVIVDVGGLSEQVRVIGIYWPQCQNEI